jgi:hypothetical protein
MKHLINSTNVDSRKLLPELNHEADNQAPGVLDRRAIVEKVAEEELDALFFEAQGRGYFFFNLQDRGVGGASPLQTGEDFDSFGFAVVRVKPSKIVSGWVRRGSGTRSREVSYRGVSGRKARVKMANRANTF